MGKYFIICRLSLAYCNRSSSSSSRRSRPPRRGGRGGEEEFVPDSLVAGSVNDTYAHRSVPFRRRKKGGGATWLTSSACTSVVSHLWAWGLFIYTVPTGAVTIEGGQIAVGHPLSCGRDTRAHLVVSRASSCRRSDEVSRYKVPTNQRLFNVSQCWGMMMDRTVEKCHLLGGIGIGK